MTADLAAQLRRGVEYQSNRILGEAADALEAMTAERDAYRDRADRATEREIAAHKKAHAAVAAIENAPHGHGCPVLREGRAVCVCWKADYTRALASRTTVDTEGTT